MTYRQLSPLCAALAGALIFGLFPRCAHAFGWPGQNDEIFPPAASATKAINFDNRGFLIHGQRVFIIAGDLHYNRIPRAMWRDRLLRIKRAGYNAIQTYVFWNFHEPHEGQFDFSGDHDLDAFLKLVKELDMYAIVRIGPYVNADADSGGLPIWLRFRPGLLPMTDNQPFYKAVEPYWRKMMPIVARNQITQGGPVIMVQLENENTRGSGTDLPDNYYKFYLKFAQSEGLVVPMFFSGLNHNDVPAGNDPFDTSQRHSPWYSTEFWTGWIAVYGVAPDRGIKLDRATWGVIAYGGAGYSHYEMAGSTDFGTLNCNEDGASYDFGAPIGQAGDFRDDYYLVKRAAMFATSFPEILANSGAANGGYGSTLTNTGLRLTGRQGPAGTILFIDNASGAPQTTQIKTADGKTYPAAGPMTIQPNEYVPIVQGYRLSPEVTLDLAAARILGIAHRGKTLSLVIHGAPGEPAEIHFGTGARTAVAVLQPAGAKSLAIAPGHVTLTAKFPADKPESFVFKAGSQVVHVLAESSALADRTWFVPVGGTTHIVTGVDYAGEASVEKGHLRIAAEYRSLTAPAKTFPLMDYGPDGARPLKIVAGHSAAGAITGPVLEDWRADAANPEAQPGFDDGKWLASDDPRPMGADDSDDAYAWYRATLHAPAAGDYELYVPDAGDWLTCFVGGKRVDSTQVQERDNDPIPRHLHVTLPAGDSKVAVLAAHYGRSKLFNYYGPLDTIDVKGMSGPVTLSSAAMQSAAVTDLRWRMDDAGEADAAKFAVPGADTTADGWADYKLNQDMFNGHVGYAWVRGTVPNVAGTHHRLQFQSVDDNCVVYLNGQRVGDHQGVGVPFSINLDPAWKDGGPNTVAVLVQNVSGPGGIFWSLDAQGGEFDSGPVVRGWRMKGGEVPPADKSSDWKPLKAGEKTDTPTWFQARFTAPSGFGPHPILRATWTGLSRGFIWLNGHNLGRYPERANIDGLYLPECWIKPGQNTLEIFDEEGQSPNQVKLEVKVPESRTDLILKD